jgi:hypothetical protein
MVSSLVSFFISARFQKPPIYEVLAHQDGIYLPMAETRQQGGQRRVVQAMRDVSEVWSGELTVQEVLKNRNPANFTRGPSAMTAA